MEHAYNDLGNAVSGTLKLLMEKVYSFMNLISSSQKQNEQELRRVQK